MSDCGHQHEAGAYVLGALSPADRAAFERHLPGCASCQGAVRDLAGLPGLLARVPIDVVEDPHDPPPVPDTLLPSLLRRMARIRRRRRTYVVTGIAAAVLAVAAIGAVAVSNGGDGPGPESSTVAQDTAARERLLPVGEQPISGWVSLTPVRWGTRIDLDCTYAAVEPGYSDAVWTYRMVVTHADGTSEDVTSWKALPGRTIHLTSGTAADRQDIRDVTIVTSDGRTVLRLRAS
ncbi:MULTISPECIES: anti-sigma factor family protein [unclassified Aeromicrobium]|uniref:anti-sigma factor family protein n=1 Tax=unclassified Aeromicrobium TaxID=2633570 RepID=UPI00396B20D0